MNSKRIAKAILSGGLVITAGLLAASLYMSLAYAETILPGIKIDGHRVEGLSQYEAATALNDGLLSEIELKVGEESVTVDPPAAGITWPVEKTTHEAYMIGHGQSVVDNLGAIVRALFITRNLPLEVSVDEVVLSSFVESSIATYVKEPVDATLSMSNGKLVVSEGSNGVSVNLEQLKQDLKQATQKEQTRAVIKVKTEIVKPMVSASDIESYKTQIETMAKVPVTVTVQDTPVVIGTADKLSWFQLNREQGKFKVVVDSKAVAATVVSVAKQTDVKAVSQQVTDNGVVLKEGKDGLSVNQSALASELTKSAGQIAAGQSLAIALTASVAVTPKQTVTVASNSDNVVPAIDTQAKFIQINLATQKMYLFEGGQLINAFAISSGKAGYETPRGVHQIYNKAVRPLSRTYGMYLPYWNAITADGGYGIHELPEWPNGYKEGENHLGIAVSHGCIRLGIGTAKYVYEWAPIGTAVVVQ